MTIEVEAAQRELIEEFQFFDNWMDRYQYLIALLLRVYNGKTPREIIDTPPEFVSALRLEQHLSPTRSNGLSSMLEAIRAFAVDAMQAA